MKQKLFTLFFVLVASIVTIYASNTQVDGIWYDFEPTFQTATVTFRGESYDDYSDEYSGSVIIPETVTDDGTTYTVTSIRKYAFCGCSSLTSITIPNSVTSIGKYAFSDCSSLTSVTIDSDSIVNQSYSDKSNIRNIFGWQVTEYIIGDNVKGIGSSAFRDCSSLTSVTISNSVTSIGGYTFRGCSSLTSVTIPNSVTSIGKYAFYNCSSLTSVTIGESVTSIGNYAFSGCSSLTSVTIGNSVTSIGIEAFYDCRSLTSVTIPNSVTSIGNSAFSDCSKLTSVTIGNSVTSIGYRAFEGTRLYKDQSNWENGVLYISNYLIKAEENISGAYKIKEGTRLIANSAFQYCSSLTSITIPNSVTSIGDNAFYYCSKLTSVTISNSVTSIGEYAFYYCDSLTSITIPNSVTSIEKYAFNNCSSLTSIIIPNSVTSLGNYAFCGCSYLTSVTINSDAIMNKSYSDDYNMLSIFGSQVTEYAIGNDVKGIGNYAFYNCSSLTSVTISNSVTSIKGSAFSECSSMTSVTIPNSVDSIGNDAFKGCNKLVDIYCYATTPPVVSESSFANYNAFLYVPCESKKSYMVDAVWGNFKYIECISSDNVPTDEIVVTPSENEANVTWPAVSGAATYELVIKDKDGNIVCTLIFIANGQLTSIAFNAPSRNGVPAQTQSAGFSFTITGLDSGTGYDLTLTAKDNSGNTIEETTIPFHTDYPEGIDNVQSDEVQSTKVLRDGQVLILRNDKTYTMQGQEVK